MVKKRKKDTTKRPISKGFSEGSSEARKIKASTAYGTCSERLSPFGGLLALNKFLDLIKLKEIFDPYYRTSTAQDFPGTGLGLSLASDIIAAHRGKIEVRSAPGEGSTFIVTLLTVSTE